MCIKKRYNRKLSKQKGVQSKKILRAALGKNWVQCSKQKGVQSENFLRAARAKIGYNILSQEGHNVQIFFALLVQNKVYNKKLSKQRGVRENKHFRRAARATKGYNTRLGKQKGVQ